MSRIQKNYFTLDELIGIWKLSEPDLQYSVENGLLTLSARIVGLNMEIGGYDQAPDGEAFYVTHERRKMDGLVNLCRKDTFTLFHRGHVSPRVFCLPDETFAKLIRPEDKIRLKRSDLLVHQEERRQFEKNTLNIEPVIHKKCIDFRCFDFQDELLEFTEMQSRALNFMFECAKTGVPEQHFQEILDAASTASSKLGHLFSSRPDWTRVLRKVTGRRGWYYMEPRLVVTLLM